MVLGDKNKKENIVALDIDGYLKNDVVKEIKRLINKWKLGNCLLTKTKNGWHSFFFWNLFSWEKSVEIMKGCKLVDEDFKRFKENDGFTRIRVGKKENQKPKIIEIIKSKYHRPNDVGEFFYMNYKKAVEIL